MVFNCACEKNNEGTLEVVWHHDLRNASSPCMCSHSKSTEKGLRKENIHQMSISI